MAEDGEGQSEAPPSAPSPQVVADIRAEGSGGPPKEPGWYPVRTNPNEQTYWDGTDWVGRRHWSAGTGWTEAGPETPGAVAAVMETANGPRAVSANPYAPHPAAPTQALMSPGVTLGLFLLMVCAVAMMVGSVTTWISSSTSLSGSLSGVAFSTSAAASGVDQGISSLIGINGFITLIAGMVLLLFAGLMMVSEERSLRIVTCLFSVVSLGLSVFVVVRLVEKLRSAHPIHGISLNVGWGAILVLGAAVVATLVSLFEVSHNR
jgi:hypothetical protein